LDQIQSYIRYRRKQIGDNNDIDQLKVYAQGFRYKSGKTKDHEMIFFGVELGNGSDSSHFHLGFTTVYLVKRIDDFDNRGEFNIDATYKIVKYCYPLIVFGFSDVKRQFFPVAFMFTSHEETGDYVHFYTSFKQLCTLLKISFKPKYMMSDASKAMLKATKQCLPETINLMCWFHLRMNIRKHKPLIGKDAYESVMKDVSTLHNSTCEATFKLQLNSINSKWVREGLVEFKEYFNKQWIKSSFNKWQIYHTPPGLAQTNNPVETYNSTIKTHFKTHKPR
jgi:hypothetical protein